MTDVNALLLISTACPHCSSVLQGVSELLKNGTITRLEVINISQSPQTAQQFGVRSVPYLRIGDYELEGLRSPSELKYWAEHVGSQEGMIKYFNQSLKGGGLEKVLKILHRDAAYFSSLFLLMKDPDTELPVRIGISAVIENFEGSAELAGQIDALTALVSHQDERVRMDACHYLSLTHSKQAIPVLENLLSDASSDVREEAKEALSSLRED